MKTINEITLSGRTANVKVVSASNTRVLHFSLAINRFHKGKDGNWVTDEPAWMDVVAFENKNTMIPFDSVDKGMPVLVKGRIDLDSYTKADGTKVNKIVVRAASIEKVEEKAAEEIPAAE